jgi:DNA-binding NarL/FixJ family response regulator
MNTASLRKLSDMEIDVLRYSASGLCAKEIAQILKRSDSRIESLKGNILKITESRSMTQAVYKLTKINFI